MVRLKVFGKQKYLKIGFSLFVASLPILPQIWAAVRTPPGYFFIGENAIANLSDITGVYFAAIRRFSESTWLYQNPYDHYSAPIFHYPVYLMLGKIVRLFGISVSVGFHLGVFVGAFLVSLFIFKFLGLFFTNTRQKFFAFALITFGGLYFINIPEGLGIFSYSNPHSSLAILCLFASFYFLLKIYDGKSIWAYMGLFASSLLLSAIHPWMELLVLAVFLVWSIYVLYSEKFESIQIKRFLVCLFLMLSALAPFVAYYTAHIPWVSFPLGFSTSMLFLVYGPLVVSAFVGIVGVVSRNNREKKHVFLICWLGVQIILLYSPFAFQRRFFEGMFFPMGALSVLGVDYLIARFKQSKFTGNIYIYSFIVLAVGVMASYVYTFWWVPNQYTHNKISERQAMQFINVNSKANQVVLSLPRTSTVLATGSSLSFYVGHEVQTPEFEKKFAKARNFLSSNMQSWEQENLLATESICYVYAGGEGNAKTKFGANEALLDKIFENKEVAVYKTKWCN